MLFYINLYEMRYLIDPPNSIMVQGKRTVD
jgi:hypothetical protein